MHPKRSSVKFGNSLCIEIGGSEGVESLGLGTMDFVGWFEIAHGFDAEGREGTASAKSCFQNRQQWARSGARRDLISGLARGFGPRYGWCTH